jgi:rare lipoprotein A
MSLKMKTSADIYYKQIQKACSGHGGLVLTACSLSLIFLAACATSKSVAPPTAQVLVPAAPEEVRPGEHRISEFEEFKGEKKSCYASWYGREFHGKQTASGENFNMFALTCAHRDYPLGTKLRVSNPANGKEVDCIVNDRGPLVTGRDIDLSYAAAKKIGLIGPGVAKVDVEPLGRYTRYVKEVKYGQLEGSMVTIQIGSFRDESNARRLKKGLDLHYKDVYIMQSHIGQDKYYRVRIGKFKNSGDAVQLAKTLAQEGYNVQVTRY